MPVSFLLPLQISSQMKKNEKFDIATTIASARATLPLLPPLKFSTFNEGNTYNFIQLGCFVMRVTWLVQKKVINSSVK